MANRGSLTIPEPSGLWLRFWAWFTDMLVLVTFAMIGALVLASWCASLGVFARLIGLVAAILYTAILDSRIGSGQTVGKRLFAIQVVGANGRPVSFARSLGRSVALWIALARTPMIRDIAMQSASAAVVIGSLFLVRATGLCILCLLLFNRETRQGLHDLIAGAFVVRKGGAPDVIAAPLRRVHWSVPAGLCVLLAVVSAVQAPSEVRQILDFQGLEHHLRQIEAFHQLRHFQASGKTLELGVQLKRPPEAFEAVQHRVAGIVLSAYPGADRIEQMEVTVACNCDLGVLGFTAKGLIQTRKATVTDWRRPEPR